MGMATSARGHRIQFGKPLFAFPRVAGKLAWMATEIMITCQLTLYAASAPRACI